MRDRPSKPLRVMVLAASAVTLSACAASPNEPPQRAPDPVIERVTETRLICPEELRLPVPARPIVADQAELTGSETGMGWLKDFMAWAGLIELRLIDAAKECK